MLSTERLFIHCNISFSQKIGIKCTHLIIFAFTVTTCKKYSPQCGTCLVYPSCFHGDWNYVLFCWFFILASLWGLMLNTLSLRDITIRKGHLGLNLTVWGVRSHSVCYHHSYLYCWNRFFILALLHDCGLFLRQAGLWEQLWLLLRMYLELNLAQPDSSHFKISSALPEQTVSKHLLICKHLLW